MPVSAGGRRFNPWSGKIPHAMGHLKPIHHNWADVLQLLKLITLEPVLCRSWCTTTREKSKHQWRPSAARNKQTFRGKKIIRLQTYPVTQSGLAAATPLQLDQHQDPLVGLEGESAILGWSRGVEKTEAEDRTGRDNKESIAHSLGQVPWYKLKGDSMCVHSGVIITLLSISGKELYLHTPPIISINKGW